MVVVPADVSVPAAIGASRCAGDAIESQRRTRTRSHSQRARRDLRAGDSDSESRAVSDDDVAGASFRALKHQSAATDGGQSAISARAGKCERARTDFGERAAAAGQSGRVSERHALSAGVNAVCLTSRRAEAARVIESVVHAESQRAAGEGNRGRPRAGRKSPTSQCR